MLCTEVVFMAPSMTRRAMFWTLSSLLLFSVSCIGVVFMAPSMTRRAMFWTLSSLLLLVWTAVPHVVDAYPMVGHTVAA